MSSSATRRVQEGRRLRNDKGSATILNGIATTATMTKYTRVSTTIICTLPKILANLSHPRHLHPNHFNASAFLPPMPGLNHGGQWSVDHAQSWSILDRIYPMQVSGSDPDQNLPNVSNQLNRLNQ